MGIIWANKRIVDMDKTIDKYPWRANAVLMHKGIVEQGHRGYR